MMDSVLLSIKKLLGVHDAPYYDDELIMFINSALQNLMQIGVGNQTGFKITNENDTWSSIIGSRLDLESIKSYVFIKTKLLFDPPASSVLMETLLKQSTELEWRINAQIEEYIAQVVITNE